MIGNKAKFVAFTSAIALMAIGGVATTSISAQETKIPIEVGKVPVGEPEMIGLVADLTKKLQKKDRLSESIMIQKLNSIDNPFLILPIHIKFSSSCPSCSSW